MRRVLAMLTVAAATCVLPLACRRSTKTGGTAGAALSSALASASLTAFTSPEALSAARVAEDRRHGEDVPQDLARSPDVVARRASAHALAEIADAPAIERLGLALSDEDAEVVAWAAYGIALPCDVDPELDREDRAKIARALAARALSLEGARVDAKAKLDPWSAIAWGLGRCGGLEASRELARWLTLSDVSRARAAAWALGAIAQHDRGLEDDVAEALLGAAQGGEAGAPLDEALYPFGRGDWSAHPPAPRLAEVVRGKLASASPARAIAIRAVGRGDAGKPEDLRALLADPSTSPGELVAIIDALHRLGPSGDAEIAAFATRNAPTDEAKTSALLGPRFGAIRSALEQLGKRGSSLTASTSLRAFLPAGAPPIAATTSPSLARRLATLRCLAAAALHPGAPADADVVRCAAYAPAMDAKLRVQLDAIRDSARLDALDHGDVSGDRRELLVHFAKESIPRLRERAIGILAAHPEAEETPDVIVKALEAKELGVVAAGAQALVTRASMASSIAKSAIDAALDPTAPPPEQGKTPPRELDVAVKKALDGVLERPFESADAETEAALAAAIAALRYGKGHAFVMRLCVDRGPALRRAARLALAQLDGPAKGSRCELVSDYGEASPLATASPAPVTLALETDEGALTMRLDPTFAPIAVARISELATAGFYDGIVVHRVAPGFVVQFGDPGGDGFGGAHASLRDETAPVPFDALDIGIALAGRDTGSSQLFVTLARTPHLDGSYTWLGHADGPWDAVAEGDVIIKATAGR